MAEGTRRLTAEEKEKDEKEIPFKRVPSKPDT